MDKLKGYIIPLVVIVTLAIGCGTYFYTRNKLAIEEPSNTQATSTEQVAQSSCEGVNDPYYNLGFGIEHAYHGNIKGDMPVKIVLSCDHNTFTITGSVQQIITTKDTVASNYAGEISELADLTSGTEVVTVATDYNFDGYNDLSSIISNGQGVNQVDSYNIFLYDPGVKKFIFNKEVSAIENVYIAEGSKAEIASDAYYSDGYKTTFYKWSQGKLIQSRTTTTCTDTRRNTTELDGVCR